MRTMKTSILMMSLAVAAMTFTSCNKEENETVVDNWNGEIRLSSGVTVQTRANVAPDTQIADGQKVGVFITDANTSPTDISTNLQYTANGSGALTLVSGESQPYYPADGGEVKIYAYHPYNASTNAATSFVTNIDQNTTDANYYNSDLLYSFAAANYGRQSAAHSLPFEHKLSNLTYELKAGTGTPNIVGATVTWTNVCNTATFNKTTGAVTNPTNTVAKIIPHATHGAIIVPQTVASGTALMEVVLADGGKLTYKPEADEKFESGKKYHYKITVNLSGLSVTSTIKDWEKITKTGTAEM